MFDRLGRVMKGALDPDKLDKQGGRQPTIENLLPGDVVSLWDDGDVIVEAVLECAESLNERSTTWRWNLLDDGRMLETAPDGNVLYTQTDVLTQDSGEFEALTCDVEHGGVLKSFEQRVREGTAARNPALLEYGGKTYRVISTGTFAARPLGATELPKQQVWRDVHATKPGENVFFELDVTEEAEPGGTTTALGIWTTHIALLFGRSITEADVRSIYPGAAK
jgi:hypothetical protein